MVWLIGRQEHVNTFCPFTFDASKNVRNPFYFWNIWPIFSQSNVDVLYKSQTVYAPTYSKIIFSGHPPFLVLCLYGQTRKAVPGLQMLDMSNFTRSTSHVILLISTNQMNVNSSNAMQIATTTKSGQPKGYKFRIYVVGMPQNVKD